jgi:hypothetical protein
LRGPRPDALSTSIPRHAAVLVAFCLLFPAASARATEIRVDGLLRGRAAEVASQAPWIEAGFGKLTDGDEGPDDFVARFQGEAQLGLELRTGDALLVHLHGLARTQPDAARGSQVGLVEAFLQSRPELSATTRLRATAGLMFPPTSRENVDPLWSSPYTLTLSALNTWVAEELRLAGAELGVTHKTSRDDDLLAAVTVFGANDSAGALLAWRGWTLGDRLSSLGEELPLPPLPTLAPGGAFGLQRADGTRPIDELDGRPGFQARARWSRPGVALLQAAYLDNRGDRQLHRGQYAWRTRMASAAAEVHLGSRLIVVAEAATGDTGMGLETAAHVDLDFAVGYVLASWTTKTLRLTARYDRFDNRDRDGTAEPNQEDGQALTVAVLWQPHPKIRVGLEGLRLWNERPAAAYSGASPDADAKRLLAELRFRF